LIEDCISNVRTNAPEAQSWLAPRFSVGKRDSTSSLRSPVGMAQGHYLCKNQWLPTPRPSLRRNNPPQRMSPGQHDATMIDLRLCASRLVENRQTSALNQCPPASRAPVGYGLLVEHRPALAANSLHTKRLPDQPAIFLWLNFPFHSGDPLLHKITIPRRTMESSQRNRAFLTPNP
jgi:hypothetical protein